MKVAAAYIRVSTDDQLEYSPDSQLEKIKLYAEKNQILLPEEFIFVDEGISGRKTKNRPAFNEMIGLAKCNPKPFDVILVWKFSRFARNREDSIVYKSMLRKERNIDVVSVSEDIGDDKLSILIEAIIEAMDEFYSINLAEEVKRGMTEKAKRGGVLSIPGFGYKVENGEYVIVPEEAEIIRKVFNDYLNKKGFLTIAKELNAMGIKTHRNCKIENRTIDYWLHNMLYIGKICWSPNGKRSRNYNLEDMIISGGHHEPIIDMETWDKTQERLVKQKEKYGKYYNSNRKDLSHWLTGLLRCEKCGKVLSYQGGYFGCSERSRGKCDGVGYIKAEKIANIILNILSEIELPNVELEFAEPNSAREVNINDDNRIISAQIQRLEIRLERVKLAYEDGVDTLEEYKAKKKAITDEIDKLNEMLEQAQEEEPKEEVKLNKKELRRLTEVLKDADVSNMEKNNMARTIFKEIIKGGDDVKRLKCVFWRH
ncbi:MAG: recombinase family protein [Ruminococcaceae bacterium]|nr:recombinase family protein [Oscillospiraceae bacterium]